MRKNSDETGLLFSDSAIFLMYVGHVLFCRVGGTSFYYKQIMLKLIATKEEM